MPEKARRTDAGCGRSEDVERYELLRCQALEGGASGFRLGLALLERRGVAAWARAWPASAPVRTASLRPAAEAIEFPQAGRDLVGALASLALARVAAG
jgi:hypothetical protein